MSPIATNGNVDVATTAARTGDMQAIQDEAKAVIRAVKKALTEMVGALPGPLNRPADLQRTLGLESRICWQIFNVMRFTDPLAAAPHVPTKGYLKKVLENAAGLGVDAMIIDRVREACAEFDKVVEEHANNRAEFDAMLTAISSDQAASPTDISFRRLSFRGDGHTWGIQTAVNTFCNIVRRSATGAGTDECSIMSKTAIRRLRPGAPMSVYTIGNYGVGGAVPIHQRQPLDPQSMAKHGVPVLPQFCSNPLPLLNLVGGAGQFTTVQVLGDAIGRRSAVNLTFGTVVHGCPLAAGPNGQPQYQVDLRTAFPAELAISDCLVHRPSFGRIKPTLRVFRQTIGDESELVARTATQLPMRETVEFLGSGADAVTTPDVPFYPELIARAFALLGWDAEEFDLYRVRIPYPILHSVIRMQFSTAEPDTAVQEWSI